jgi:nucleoside phosphorylase
MEAYQQAYSAFINGVPFASFKVISDNANFLATLQFFWHISKNGNIFAEIIGDYISLLS